ncbi:GNAT family N-acetyltransferase [Flavobacteriales bacterium]|nr:GNAT family N-acetyltransferase [Flavobacteriales bacterium]MDA7794556.1 GNAT family N-acetyltransferase [Flavobacteriales bacterium]
MNIQLHTSSQSVDIEQWKRIGKDRNPFLYMPFKQALEKNHTEGIKHLYYMVDEADDNIIGYAQKFSLGGGKISAYQKRNSVNKGLVSFLLGLLKLDVVVVGNGLITNVNNITANSIRNKDEFVTALLDKIRLRLSVGKFIIPDHFFSHLKIENPEVVFPKLIKIEIEEDMKLRLSKDWKSFADYTDSLKKKYRTRLRGVMAKSDSVTISLLSKDDLIRHEDRIQELFENVKKNSSFGALTFNSKVFKDLITLECPKSKVYGLFLKKELIGFSSELIANNNLYSYFIGLDYTYNQEYRIYERILNESIKHGIECGAKEVIFGRTAAEFKSNVGATPEKSHIYIHLHDPLLRWVLRPILSKIKPKKWTQRHPFKVTLG